MRENGLQAANRPGRPRGPRSHDGTIISDTIDTMWGTDMAAGFTVEQGQVAVFVAVDRRSSECVGVHVALHGTRHEALEPVRQGVAERFGNVEKDAARGLAMRHDHGGLHVPRLPARDHLARREVLTRLHPCPREQRLRRAVHPDAEGEPLLVRTFRDVEVLASR
jgi:hypothetical protein